MKRKNITRLSFFVIVFILFSGFRTGNPGTKQISLDFTSKILENGKYMVVSGEMYYDLLEKRMTTHIVKPFESVVIANSNGEMKIYDPKENSLVYSNSPINTTESSYFHHFFSSSTSDMGLKKLGFSLLDTKIDEGMLVTRWIPKTGTMDIKRIELAHQKSDIRYMGIISPKEKFVGKIFFSQHSKVGGYTVPLSITEINYNSLKDSTITKKIYSNAKVNEQVNSKFINYQIPKNAKVIKVGK